MGNETVTLEKLGEGIEKINNRLDGMDDRFDSMEIRIEKRLNKLTASLGSLEFDMLGIKSTLEKMNSKYDETFAKLSAFP